MSAFESNKWANEIVSLCVPVFLCNVLSDTILPRFFWRRLCIYNHHLPNNIRTKRNNYVILCFMSFRKILGLQHLATRLLPSTKTRLIPPELSTSGRRLGESLSSYSTFQSLPYMNIFPNCIFPFPLDLANIRSNTPSLT